MHSKEEVLDCSQLRWSCSFPFPNLTTCINVKANFYFINLQKSVETFDLTSVEDADYGRTWITIPSSGSLEVDQLYLYNGAHLALEPAANPASAGHSFTTEGFYGDNFVNNAANLGTIHVGPYQTFTVRYVRGLF